MERQKQRRFELEEEKRALTFSPSMAGGGGSIVGGGSTRRRIIGAGNQDAYDSPRSGFSGTSSMYTDEKGLTVGVGGVTVEGNRSHMLLGGDHETGGSQFAVPHPQPRLPTQHKTIDLLDYSDGSGTNQFGTIQQTLSQGEMSV